MEYIVNYKDIDKYWKDDYYFCEDKILANVANLFGSKYELMFSGTFNLGYNRDHRTGIGKNIVVKYFKQDELLEKYYGIRLTKYGKRDGAEKFLEVCKKELVAGRPVATGLENHGIWQVKLGEEAVDQLPFMIIGLNDETVTMIDPHELGMRRTISIEVFKDCYLWGVTFYYDETKAAKEIDIKDFIQFVLDCYHNTVISDAGCMDVSGAFLSLSSDSTVFEPRKIEAPYEEMLKLAEDVRTMDFETEINGLGGVLFVPFYFDLLFVYRSRLVFTKALCEIQERMHVDIFKGIIERLIVTSSKWNYLRMVFTNCFHKGKMEQAVKDNMSSVIREIADHEKKVIEELEVLQETYQKERIEEVAQVSQYFNTYLFDHANWRSIEESKTVYGRYYYEEETASQDCLMKEKVKHYLAKPTEKGDSIVCLGQKLEFTEKITSEEYKEFRVGGTVLYNEMIYDYMDILYSDGSTETVLIGFDGWIKNEYSLGSSGDVIWEGKVVKRESNEKPDARRKAVIYERTYLIPKKKKVQGIKLPNNPFINIIGLIFVK